MNALRAPELPKPTPINVEEVHSTPATLDVRVGGAAETDAATTKQSAYDEYRGRVSEWQAARAAGDAEAERQAERSMRSLEGIIAGNGPQTGESREDRPTYEDRLASHEAWSATRAGDPAQRSRRALEAVTAQQQAEDVAAGRQLANDFFEARSALIEARRLGQDTGPAQDTYDTLLRQGAERMRRDARAAGKSGSEAEEIVASYREAEERYLAEASRNEPEAEAVQPEAGRRWHHRARSLGRAALSRLGQGFRRGERTEASPAIAAETEATEAPASIEAHAAEEPGELVVTAEMPAAVAAELPVAESAPAVGQPEAHTRLDLSGPMGDIQRRADELRARREAALARVPRRRLPLGRRPRARAA